MDRRRRLRARAAKRRLFVLDATVTFVGSMRSAVSLYTRILVGLGVAVVAGTLGCGSATSTPSSTPLEDALNGSLDPQTQAAMSSLAASLVASDWTYLLNVTWPAGASDAALADPYVQKALAPLMTSTRSTKSRALRDAPALAKYYEQARQLMMSANGSATVGTPGALTAFLQGIAQTVTTLPAPGSPVDSGAQQCVVEFFANGQSTSTCTTTPPCCKGVIDFTAGTSTCFDATSCMGAGLPSPASDTFSIGPMGGGGSGSDPCSDNWYLLPSCDCHLDDTVTWVRADNPAGGGSSYSCCESYGSGDTCTMSVEYQCLEVIPNPNMPGTCCTTAKEVTPTGCSHATDTVFGTPAECCPF